MWGLDNKKKYRDFLSSENRLGTTYRFNVAGYKEQVHRTDTDLIYDKHRVREEPETRERLLIIVLEVHTIRLCRI